MLWQDLIQRIRFSSSVFVAGCAVCFGVAMASEPFPAPQDEQAVADEVVQKVGMIQSGELAEISGITRSVRFPQSAWVQNDSGNESVVYLISWKGQLLARFPLVNIRNRDWEDICSFEYQGKNYLLIGDVGDNQAVRASCQLHLFGEPEVQLDPREVVDHPLNAVQSISYIYEDGPRNCEAIAFDELSETVLAVEKRPLTREASSGAGVYAIDIRPWLNGDKARQRLVSARRIAELPLTGVTGMAISPDGRKLVLRDYLQGYLLQRSADQTWEDCIRKTTPLAFALPVQRQGEAVCFTDDGERVLLASEFTRQPIWMVRIPTAASNESRPAEKK